MCLAVPGKVTEIIDPLKAVVDIQTIKREVNIALVDVNEGDYVLVHAGVALNVIDEDDAKETIGMLKELDLIS